MVSRVFLVFVEFLETLNPFRNCGLPRGDARRSIGSRVYQQRLGLQYVRELAQRGNERPAPRRPQMLTPGAMAPPHTTPSHTATRVAATITLEPRNLLCSTENQHRIVFHFRSNNQLDVQLFSRRAIHPFCRKGNEFSKKKLILYNSYPLFVSFQVITRLCAHEAKLSLQ